MDRINTETLANHKDKPSTSDRNTVNIVTENEVKQLFAVFLGDLSKVENRIASTFSSDASDLSEISQYLLDLGGKRIRPLLALLSSRLFGMDQPSNGVIDIASGIELIHMATLLHDDIIDDSSTRRGKQSALLKFGRDATMLTGDFLFVRAFGLCGLLDDFTIKATEQACVELIEGENLEGVITPEFSRDLAEYITVIEKKTAALFALACQLGAHLAGASQADSQHMRDFGLYAGIAFQVVDDILDVVADENLLGKKSGSDLRQATPSIINLLWLEDNREEADAFFSKLSQSEESDQSLLVAEAVQKLKNSAIIEQSRDLAASYVEKADQSLSQLSGKFGDSNEANMLRSLLSFTLNRCM
jgi:geranylgeranyl pyrophosphate synthase